MNARSYKTVFSKRLGCLVAVGEHASSQGKANGAGSGGGASGALSYVAALSASFAFVSLAWAAPAFNALPTSGQVVQGAASMSQTANQMTINQSTQRAIINWQSFNIGAGARVQVVQPNAQSVLLNRVVGQSPSQIFGQLSANGHVILQNPNGVLFGKDGSVNAASFTATTLGISDANFMAGNMLYERNGSTAGIVNEGTITVAPGGYVALLGASVSNEGKIDSKGGNVFLAAADTIKVPVSGTGRIKLELTAADMNANVSNSGSIITEGGQVYMQALALNRAAAQIIQSGSIDTSGEQGGSVNILADGGKIRVSGSIKANSTDTNKKGGDIVIGRDEETGALAHIADVSGAQLESRRGFVETSGGTLQTDNVYVKAGKWLLDPYDIEITDAANSLTSGYTTKITTQTLQSALNNGTDVTIQTTAATGPTTNVGVDTNGGSAGTGNILVSSAITKNANTSAGGADPNASLTLLADKNITVNAGITSTSGALDVTLKAGQTVSGGAITIASAGTITANGGNVILQTKGGNITSNAATAITGTNIAFDNTGGTIAGDFSSITDGNQRLGGINGIVLTGAGVAATDKLTMLGGVAGGNGLASSAALIQGKTINIAAKTTGATAIALNGGTTVRALGNGGSSTLTGTASGNSTTAATLIGGVNNFTAESGSTLSIVGDATYSAATAYYQTRGLRVTDGAQVTTNGDVTLKGSSKSSDGLLLIHNGGFLRANSGSLTLDGTTAGNGSIATNGGGAGVNIAQTVQALNGSNVIIKGIAANSTSAVTEWAVTTGSLTGSGGTLTITGGASSFGNSGGILMNGAVTGFGNVDILGQNLRGSGGDAVKINSTLTATGNVLIQSNGGRIWQTANTLTAGGRLTVDNTGAGRTSLIADNTGGLSWTVGTSMGGAINNGAVTTQGIGQSNGSQHGVMMYGTVSSTGAMYLSGRTADTNAAVANSIYTSGTLAATGGLTIHGATPSVITSTITGGASNAGGVTKVGNSTTIVTGTNTYKGGTTISAGTLQVGNAGSTGNLGDNSGAVSIASGANLDLYRIDTGLNLGNAISGTGTINAKGSGVINQSAYALSGNNAGFSGVINISNARLGITAANNVGAASQINVNAGGQLYVNGNTTVNNSLSLAGNGWNENTWGALGALRLQSGATYAGNLTLAADSRIGAHNSSGTISGAITGNKNLEISSGTVTLTSNGNSYAATSVSGGTLQIGNGGATGTLGAGDVTLSNNSSLVFNRSASTTINNAISGAGSVSAAITGASSDLTVAKSINLTGGTINLASDRDLNLQATLATTNATSGAITLNAGKSTAAGTASGGDVSFSGSGGVSVGAGGRATLLTGSVTGSTGLGIAAGNHRYNSDEVATNYTSALGSGTYAVYREAPTLFVNVNNASKAYDGNAFIGGNGFTESGATGLKNSDTLANAVSSATWGGSAQNALNAGTYTLTASESVSGKSALGYVTTYSAGTLTVNKKDVTLDSITAANKIYNGNDTASITSGSVTTGVGTETLLISGTGIFSSKNAADSKTVTVSDVTALTKTNGTGDWNNYNLTTTGAMTTTANIAKKDVTLAGITAANKAYDGGDTASITAGSIATGVGSETLLVSGVGRFSDKNAADGKTVTVSDVAGLTKTNGTGDWTNYNLTTTGAMTTMANIAKKDVILDSITAASKTYNGSDVATITSGSINTGVGTETLLISGTGTFSDKNADVNKLVTVADVSTLTKTNGTGDWSNYNLATTGAKTAYATIEKATLSAALTGTVEKVYDGTTAASNLVNANFAVTGWVAGEGATVSQTAASYSSKNVSDNIGAGAVSAVLSSSHFTAAAGTLLSNYELPTTASGNVGKITPAPLVVKVNDSAAFVTMNASQATDNGLSYTGFVNGENAASALTGIGTRTYLPASQTPVAGTYTEAFGLSTTPTALNGNYTVTVQKGDLTVVPADKLLITIAGKTETYGVLTAANAGLSASTVTAQYCLTSNCSSSLVDLTVSRLPDGRWQATDATGTSVTFSTLVDTTGKISTGGFVNAGNYTYDASNTLPPSGTNFNGRVVNGGVLTIDPKAVTLEASGVTKTYDGSMALAGRSVDITNAMSGDQVSASSSGGSFVGKNAGTQGYTLTGLSLSGADSANYSIATQLSGSDGRIDTRSVILTAGSVVKTYDGSTSYAVTQADLDALSLQLVPGDRVTAAQLVFADKNVSRAGNGTVLSDKTVTLNSVTLNDGNSGGNYSLTLQGNQTSTINPKTLQAAGAVADKVYDGTRLATLGDLSGSGVVAGDVVSFQASSALFDSKNVLRDGGGQVLDRMVTVSGLTLGGPQAGNYDLSSGSFTTQAKILPLELYVEASAQNKTYDGTRAASGTLDMTGVLTGESVSLNWGAGQFASKDVARDGTGQVTAQTVTFAGLQLAGPDADNYSLALTTATTTARITPKLLSVSGTRVANKTQDGTTQAEASAGSLSGLVGAEMLQAVAMASFDSASAGSNKNVTVRYSLANGSNGGLAGNYELMDEVFTASILAQAGGNPVQPLVIPAESTVQSYLRSSGSSATAVTTSKPELESRNECSSLTPEDCDCQPSTLSGVDICMVPLKVVRDRPGLQLGVTSLRD